MIRGSIQEAHRREAPILIPPETSPSIRWGLKPFLPPAQHPPDSKKASTCRALWGSAPINLPSPPPPATEWKPRLQHPTQEGDRSPPSPAAALASRGDISQPSSAPPRPQDCGGPAHQIKLRDKQSKGADLASLRSVPPGHTPLPGGAASTRVHKGLSPRGRVRTLLVEEVPLRRLFLSLQPPGPQGATSTSSHSDGI